MNNIKKIGVITIRYFIFPVIIYSFLSCATKNHLNFKEKPLEQSRFYDEAGGFSFIPPERWREYEGSGVKAFIGQRENNYSPNLGFSIETVNGQLKEFVDLLIEYYNTSGQKLLKRDNFVTLKNLTGEMVLAEITARGVRVRAYYYFFPGSDKRIFYAVFTVLAEDDNKYDEMFNNSMKTFEWIDPSATAKSNNNRDGSFIEKSGEFLIIPKHESWEAMKFPGREYNSLVIGNNNEARIFFEISELSVRLKTFVTLFNEELEEKGWELIQRDEFVTLKRLEGEKIIIKGINDKGQNQQVAVYFFPGKNKKVIIITCVIYEYKYNIYDEIFDKTVETFEWT
jgi:hypothetical protein